MKCNLHYVKDSPHGNRTDGMIEPYVILREGRGVLFVMWEEVLHW